MCGRGRWSRSMPLRKRIGASVFMDGGKETIERSFAEAKENHGLRYARMLGIRNMREQCFLTAAVQNIKRLVASFYRAFQVFLTLYPCACI